MPKIISEKVAFILKIFSILTLGFLSNIAIAMEVEEDTCQEQRLFQQKYNLPDLFQHIVEENQIKQDKFLGQQQGALTDILKKEPKQAWELVLDYIAKSDFILETLYSFRKLSNNELLNRLAMQKDSWGVHVHNIGNLLEDYGIDLVSDPKFGPSLKNLISCKFKMTTFIYLQSLAHTIQEAKKSDKKAKESADEIQKLVKKYLETHNLLK